VVPCDSKWLNREAVVDEHGNGRLLEPVQVGKQASAARLGHTYFRRLAGGLSDGVGAPMNCAPRKNELYPLLPRVTRLHFVTKAIRF
jgi:hypothetical protein